MKVEKGQQITYAQVEEISAYTSGYFKITVDDGTTVKCELTDDSQWDMLYDYLLIPITLRVDNAEDDKIDVTIIKTSI